MDKRYQVFVSSTFQDLQEERREVMQVLLELECIPAGMELFPAANDDQWTLITNVIDDCDYYLLIIGGRYGSIGPDGLSYTEMEYRYALEKQKPIIAFIHNDPGSLPANRTEDTPEGREKLEAFRELAKQKLVRFWRSPAELGSLAIRGLINLKRTNPAVGWVRGDELPNEDASAEILRLRRRIEELESALESSQTEAPKGTEDLAQGNDALTIHYTYRGQDLVDFESYGYHDALHTNWNEVFAAIAPLMIGEARDNELKAALNEFVQVNGASDRAGGRPMEMSGFTISESDFQTIKVQLRALGLITPNTRPRAVKDTATYWKLTQHGDDVMNRLRAVKK
jgi:hypothetical protein